MKFWAIVFLIFGVLDLASDLSMCLCVRTIYDQQPGSIFSNKGDDICPDMQIMRSDNEVNKQASSKQKLMASKMMKINTKINSVTTMGMVISGLIMAIKILGGSN